MEGQEDKTYCVLYKYYKTPGDQQRGIDSGYVASFHHNGGLERLLFEGHYHWSIDRIKKAIQEKYHIKEDFPIAVSP